MNFSFKVVAAALAMALAAMVINSGPAATAESDPAALSSAPPTFLISARGLSTDGIFTEGEDCSVCANPGYCGCFLADATGGNGYFQFSNSATTPMSWAIELDFDTEPGNLIPTTIEGDYCFAAQGSGEGE
jgi:hypothetical protein